jgi:hypothetical protein
MKYIKMLGLLSIATVALLAFAGAASATTLTSPAGTTYTGTIKAESSNSSIHGSFITVSCGKSTFEGKVEQHGAGVPAEGKLSSLTFSECNYSITRTINIGVYRVHSNGWWTFIFGIHIHTSVGECVFTANATTTNFTGGSPAKIDLDSAAIPRTGGSFFCGSSGEWTGNYTITSPSSLYVD